MGDSNDIRSTKGGSTIYSHGVGNYILVIAEPCKLGF